MKSINAIKEQALTNVYDITATTALLNMHMQNDYEGHREKKTSGHTLLGVYAVHFANVSSTEREGSSCKQTAPKLENKEFSATSTQ